MPEERQRFVAEISACSSYGTLISLMNTRLPLVSGSEEEEQAVAGELAAFALLQAANLRETIDVASMTSLTIEEAGKRMDDAENLIKSLLPLIEDNIDSYEIQTQLAIVSALAQLQHYSEVVLSSVAATSVRLSDATGGMMDALASSGSIRIIPPRDQATSSSSSAPMDETGILGMQLMMIASSYAMLGHYDSDLFDLIAKQTVELGNSSFPSSSGLSNLVNILGAFMDVQHFDQDLLMVVGQRVASDMTELSIDDLASSLLIFAFFNVRNADFYMQVLETIGNRYSALGSDESIDPRTASLVYRGVKLLPEAVPIPPSITLLLDSSLKKYGPVALSTMVPAVRDLASLTEMDRDMDDDSLFSIKAYQIAIVRDMHSILKQVVGAEGESVGKFEVAASDGWLLAHVSVRMKGRKIAYQVIGDDLVCSNDSSRYKGQVQSEISVMQREGWAVAVVTASEWTLIGARIVEECGDKMEGFDIILEELNSKTQVALEELDQTRIII